MTAPAVVQELYLKSCNESMKCYEALCTAGSGHDAAGYATPQGLRNVLLISATLISGNISSASGYAEEIQMKQGSCC